MYLLFFHRAAFDVWSSRNMATSSGNERMGVAPYWFATWCTCVRVPRFRSSPYIVSFAFKSTPAMKAGHGIVTHLSWSVTIPCPTAGLARYTKTQVYRVANALMQWMLTRPCSAMAWTLGHWHMCTEWRANIHGDTHSFVACHVCRIHGWKYIDSHAWFTSLLPRPPLTRPRARQWVDQLVVRKVKVVTGPCMGRVPVGSLPFPLPSSYSHPPHTPNSRMEFI